ncbi:MAG: inorganic diphosphatase [Candidatus Kapabacteria bacterium]|nr:inorganic diphosphatase [Candidatus Kapabacteria bacterium]
MYKIAYIISLSFLFFIACGEKPATDVQKPQNLLYDIAPFTSDSLVNVVIEIPAGTNQKWEVNKVSGQLEWEQLAPDSFRVINYLPYPANYGFVPQTLLPEASGGDGDPVDVFVLGEHIERGTVVPCRIIGYIEMIDSGEQDNKFIAIQVPSQWNKVHSFQDLNQHYPGVLDILRIWLTNYKGVGKMEILSEYDGQPALDSIYKANRDFYKQ